VVSSAKNKLLITDEEEAFAITDELDNIQLDATATAGALAMLDPEKAAQLVAGVRPDTLIYKVQMGRGEPIVGLTAQGTQILAARVGGFETLPEGQGSTLTAFTTNIEVASIITDEETGEQKTEKTPTDIEAIRASVCVRYTSPSGRQTTFVGVDEEPRQMSLRIYENNGRLSGGGLRDDPKAAVKAFNKAERNAIRKFFAPAEKLLVQFAQLAESQGKVLMVGDEPSEDLTAAVGRVEAYRTRRRAEEPTWGEGKANSFRKAAAKKGVPEEVWLKQLGYYGVAKLEDMPASALGPMQKWLQEQTGQEPASDVTELTKDLHALGKQLGYTEEAITDDIGSQTDGSADELRHLVDSYAAMLVEE